MANRTHLKWQAPTENTDGTPIDYALDYELGRESNGDFVPLAVFPGTLNQDGSYSAPLADFALDYGTHTMALRAINRDKPHLISEWSNSISFTLSTETPKAPFGLSAV